MQLSFRWYGNHDPVSLSQIRQIPRMKGIVSSLSTVPIGEVWEVEAIRVYNEQIKQHDMEWLVVESLPVHEEIKWAGPRRDMLIERWQTSLQNLGIVGIPVVCYNFMPICDWMRTKLQDVFPDGSNGLSYYHKDLNHLSIVEILDWKMPAWASYTKEEMKVLQENYSRISEETLRENMRYFLQAVVPVAEKMGVKLAVHPDDPPWSIFGLPRIVKNKKDLQIIMDMVNSPVNGITFCTGSLGANPNNNLVDMINQYKERIHFAHSRNVETDNAKNFREVPHAKQSTQAINLSKIIQAYKAIGFSGPMRPDHGRMMWGETGTAGYGLYDRALGSMYLQGLWDAV